MKYRIDKDIKGENKKCLDSERCNNCILCVLRIRCWRYFG